MIHYFGANLCAIFQKGRADMLIRKFSDNRDFTHKLFLEPVFDDFYLSSARFDTAVTIQIDGKLNTDFFDEEGLGQLKDEGTRYISWKEIRPTCFSFIRGKKPPLLFKIVLIIPGQLQKPASWLSVLPIDGQTDFFLNLGYMKGESRLTTGISTSGFTMNREPQQIWDQTIENYLSQNQLAMDVLT